MVFEMGQSPRFMKTIPPPFLHREPKFDFFKVWKKLGGKFESAKPFLEFVEEEIESKMNEYESYRDKEKREDKKKKKKKGIPAVRDYDRILEIIKSYYNIRRMEFTSMDIKRSLPQVGLRNIQRILPRLVQKKTLEDLRGKPKKYRIINI